MRRSKSELNWGSLSTYISTLVTAQVEYFDRVSGFQSPNVTDFVRFSGTTGLCDHEGSTFSSMICEKDGDKIRKKVRAAFDHDDFFLD